MNNTDEVPQPRVIARVGDDDVPGSGRLIWVPPRPLTEAECHERHRSEGAMAEGRFVVEVVERNALNEPFWQSFRYVDEGDGLYPLILKLHTAYEEAWAQREDYANRLFVVVRDAATRADDNLLHRITVTTPNIGSGDYGAAAAATTEVTCPTCGAGPRIVCLDARRMPLPGPGAHAERIAKLREARDWGSPRTGIDIGRAVLGHITVDPRDGSSLYGGIFSSRYDDAADASVETVSYRARRLTDRFFKERSASTQRVNGDVERRSLFEIAYAELEDCEQVERLRKPHPRDTETGYTDPDHPHIVNGEFQSDKYPTTPRGKVPLSVKDATAQDLLWVYAQRRRSVDEQFSADLEYALSLAGFTPRAVYADEPQNNAVDLRGRLGYCSTQVRGAAAEVTRPDLRTQLINVANEIQKAIAHPFLNAEPPAAPAPAEGSEIDRTAIFATLERWRHFQNRIPVGVVPWSVTTAIDDVNAANQALRDIYAMFDGEPLWRQRYNNACRAAIEAQEALAAEQAQTDRVAVRVEGAPIDIEAVGEAASEIQSAYSSLTFAPPEGQRLHVMRMVDAIQDLANALGLKPPSELSPPVARLIKAACAMASARPDAKELVAAVKAYEAQT